MGPPNTAVLVHRVDRLLTRAARWSDLRLPWGEGVIQKAQFSVHAEPPCQDIDENFFDPARLIM